MARHVALLVRRVGNQTPHGKQMPALAGFVDQLCHAITPIEASSALESSLTGAWHRPSRALVDTPGAEEPCHAHPEFLKLLFGILAAPVAALGLACELEADCQMGM